MPLKRISLTPPKSQIGNRKSKIPTPPHLLTGKPAKTMTFTEKVYTLTTTIPRGKVTTYGSLAAAAGNPLAARAVGTAMRTCPYDLKHIPCHRVIASTRNLHGFGGEPGKKKKLLQAEGVKVTNDKVPAEYVVEL